MGGLIMCGGAEFLMSPPSCCSYDKNRKEDNKWWQELKNTQSPRILKFAVSTPKQFFYSEYVVLDVLAKK